MDKPKLVFRGPVLTSSGYGVHSRQLLQAIVESERYDVSVVPIKWGETSFIHEDTPFVEIVKKLSVKFEEEKQRQTKYDISVQVTIPNEFQKMARFNVGVTAGIEVDHVSPQWILKCNSEIDFLIVPSQHSADVFHSSRYQGSDGSVLMLNKRAHVVPEGVDTAVFNNEPSAIDLQLDVEPEFNFIHVGLGLDKGPGEDRKNIGNLIRWFCERFKGDKNVGLILKTSIVNGSLLDYELVKRRVKELKESVGAKDYPRVTVVHGRLTDDQLAALYKHPRVKAFVSLTHGEGYGLPLLEAAACDLPVIATNWSGHLDFLRKDGKPLFIPVEHEMKNVPDSVVWDGVIERGSSWASVKEEDAKLKLLKVAKSYETPKRWATELGKHVRETYSVERTKKMFVDALDGAIKGVQQQTPATRQSLVSAIKSQLKSDGDGKKLLFTMPMSAGDVFISTGIVAELKKKFPGHQIYFATNPPYRSILEGNSDIHKVIDHQQWMNDISLCEDVFDEVYTPNLAVQMIFSNWVHRGKGRNIAEEFANACQVDPGTPKITTWVPEASLPEKFVAFHPGSGQGQWEARNYLHWQEVVDNLVANGITVLQVGTSDEPLYERVVDFRGKTKSYGELAYVISKATVVLGIDSVSMHMAGAFGVRHVALFGSSYPRSTGPLVRDERASELSVLIETPDRYTCDRACYKYQCSVDRDHPCINEIDPKVAFEETYILYNHDLPEFTPVEYTRREPKVSGYTHILNPLSHGYPFVESVKSMLGFCDEVVVIDGGSNDGSVEALRALDDPRLQIHERLWDWEEPGMDGMQKAYARAMCTGEFLWQQDADEVVHEEDYAKIRKLVKRFPRDVDLCHLPVIELWGNESNVRTDRHSWKWRLSRNVWNITHGIFIGVRVVDEKTGKTYAKKGMSDGCEYIDAMTGQFTPHRGFYNDDIERLRRNDPVAYGAKMNELFKQLPCVYHYSWCDLQRKIVNFKRFWDRCWANLYNDPAPEERFPDVSLDDPQSIVEKVGQLYGRGGEHQGGLTFKLERSNPAVMEGWLATAKLVR